MAVIIRNVQGIFTLCRFVKLSRCPPNTMNAIFYRRDEPAWTTERAVVKRWEISARGNVLPAKSIN